MHVYRVYYWAIASSHTYLHACIHSTIPGALGKYIAASFLRIQKYYIPNAQRLLLDLLPQTQNRHDFRQSIDTDARWLWRENFLEGSTTGRRGYKTSRGIAMWMCIASILYTVAIYSFYSCCGMTSGIMSLFSLLRRYVPRLWFLWI